MTINENAPPSFSVASPSRNWFETASDEPTVMSPREIIISAQSAAGATADGNWGDGTSTALIRKARSLGYMSKYVAALEKAKVDRRLNIDAFRTAVAMALGMRPETIRFGSAEAAVALPPYGQVAPGSSPARTTAPTTPTRTTPTTPTRTTPATPARALASSVVALGMTRNQLIAAGAFVSVAAAVTGYIIWKDSNPTSRPSMMPRSISSSAKRSASRKIPKRR